ncbi:hypothetical protein BRADI_1g14565v3 [Brachypodium distachyon]|uniref:Reverse transcriptase zinc-binding domain-containing protein n=1 Tax=Brachypodium distachyon TaxID=15368 RepID=A0A0Q3JQA4_BRADI|nr:hypothetical protein BRADI_1g14565v3 [Brachypodium distachyon]
MFHCCEDESIQHLMFDCVVARVVWDKFEYTTGFKIGSFLDLAQHWLNDMIFTHCIWLNMNQVWGKILRNLKDWLQLLQGEAQVALSAHICWIVQELRAPSLLPPIP